MKEVLTVVEAKVNASKWQELKQNYLKEITDIPPSIRQTFLVQSQQFPEIWRIITHWRSQEDLDHVRATVKTPVALRVFNSVGATPQLDIWNSEIHRTPE